MKRRFLNCASLFLTMTAAFMSLAQNSLAPELFIRGVDAGQVAVAWPGSAAGFALEQTSALGVGAAWQPVPQTPALQNGQFVITLDAVNAPRFFRLRQTQAPLQITRHAPLAGAGEVGVTFRPQLFFSQPINPATLTSNNFFATAAGARLAATIVPANDGSFAWLFFQKPLPGGTRVEVRVEGGTIFSADGASALDADGDGRPGGVRQFEFTTVSRVALPGTTLSGIVADPGPDLLPRTFDDFGVGPDGTFGTGDDVHSLPLAGVRVYLLGREDEVIVTGADGRFHFGSVPVGNVKVVVNGTSAVNLPAGIYFPEMVLDAEMKAGVDNWTMSDDDAVYLPRLAKTILQTVDAQTMTLVTTKTEGASGLTDAQRQQLTVEVQPNSLIGADGTRLSSGQVGISTVPPSLVRDMLPPGVLQHTFDITVQAPGIATFATPAPVTSPNVFNAPPGTKLNFLSFDHTTGRLVIEGTGTVSADGQTIRTDPGTGVTHPGWHGWPPPGSGSDPPCDPKAVHNKFYEAVPLTSGLQDYFLTEDGEKILLAFLNGSIPLAPIDSDPCNPENLKATPLVIVFDVDGPANSFLDGLIPGPVMLQPGQKFEMPLVAKALTPKIVNLLEDQFYAVSIRVTGYTFGVPNKLLLDQTIVIARFLEVSSPKTVGSPAVADIRFLKTLADGPGGFDRVQFLNVHGPKKIISNFRTLPPGPWSGNVNAQGNGYVPFTFDPQPASNPPYFVKNLNQEVQITVGKNVLIKHVILAGSAINPTTVGLNLGDFKDYLITYLEDPNHFNGKAGVLQASAAFKKLASGVGALPSQNPSIATLNLFADAVAVEIAFWVNSILAPVSFTGTALNIVSSGRGDITVDWTGDIATSANNPAPTHWFGIYGTQLGEMDRDDSQLRKFLSPPARSQLSIPAQDAVFCEYLNTNFFEPNNFLLCAIYPHAETWGGVAPFGAYLADTVCHEIGHALGLTDCFLRTGTSAPLPPRDVMSPKRANQAARFFAPENLDTMRAALGVAPDATDANRLVTLGSAERLYLKNYNLPLNATGLQEMGTVDSPHLRFTGPAGDLYAETPIDFGVMLADGTGNARTNISLTVTNDGSAAVTFKSIRLAGGTNGFSFNTPALIGKTLDIGEGATFSVTFDPQQTGLLTNELAFVTDDTNADWNLSLTGIGLTSNGRIAAQIIPETLAETAQNNFGGVPRGTQLAQFIQFANVTNIGGGSLQIRDIQVAAGQGQGQFTVLGLPAGFGPRSPLTLQPNQTFSFGLAFSANRAGLQRGDIQILSDDPTTPAYHLRVVGTGLAASGDPLDSLDYGNDFVAMETPDVPGAPVLRMKSDANGNWSFFLPPQQRYHYAIFDPISGLIAHGVGITEVSGKNTPIGIPVFLPSGAPDSDGDGLPDDIEWVIGTNPNKVDTDGNGIDDFAEVEQGLDPLGGRAFPTGVIATAQLQGEAKEVVVEAAPGDANKLLAYVATGSFGLAIVDVTKFDQPVVLSQLKLPGNANDVAVDAALKIAAVASGTNGLHLVDISDPLNPRLAQTIAIPGVANCVAVRNGIAYVPSYLIFVTADVFAVDLLSRQVLQKLTGFGNEVTDLALSTDKLFALNRSGRLNVITLSPQGMSLGGSVGLPFPSSRLFAADNVVYAVAERPAALGGYQTFDVTDPNSPKLISAPDVPANTLAPGTALALNGSGLGVLVGSPDGVTNVLDVLNTSDPQNTYSLITRYGLPAVANGVTIAGGISFVADDTAGLVVVNYAGFDTQGQPPTVALNLDNPDQDGSRAGIQIAEGTVMTLRATTSDDVQVRQVELLANGQVVQTEVSFPFEFNVVAGRAPGQMILQARATDTGGNAALSTLITIELRPDTTPPSVLRSSPVDGALIYPDARGSSITFSEPMAADSINLTSVELLDSRGRRVPLGSFEMQANDQTLAFTFTELAADSYRILLHGSNVTDRAGNALGSSDVAVRFVVAPFAREAATIQWVNKFGGAWTNAANWLPARVPNETDNVLIDTNSLAPGAIVFLPNSVELPAFWNQKSPAYGPVRFANLVSSIPLHCFYTTLQGTGTTLVNTQFGLGMSTVEGGTILVGPRTSLQYGLAGDAYPGHPLTDASAPLLSGVTLRGNLIYTNVAGADGYFVITNGLTLEGSMTGCCGYDGGGQRGSLHFLGTNLLSGHAVLDSVFVNCWELGGDHPDATFVRVGYGGTLTIGTDILIHGRSILSVRNENVVVNQGTIRADAVDPRAFESMGLAIYDDSLFINEGTLEAVEKANLHIYSDHKLPRLLNRGILRAAGTAVINLAEVELQSSSTTLEPGAVFFPQGRIATEPGRVSVMSGAGIWLAESYSPTTLAGGAVTLANGAQFNGAANFYGVVVNGDWNFGGSSAARAAAEKFGPGGTYFNQLPVVIRQSLILNGTVNRGGAQFKYSDGARSIEGNAILLP